MKILIVDNNKHLSGYPQGMMIRFHLPLKYALSSVIRSADELSKKDLNVDRVILTSSTAYVREQRPWMKKEIQFIRLWMEKKIPILSICFGAQLLSSTLFGKESVRALPVPISGSLLMNYQETCPLFQGLPNPFGVVSTHYEAFVVPKKFRVASIEDWESYAFVYKKNVFGIQFHPELMGFLGRTFVKIQRSLFDRHIYQDLLN